MKIVKVKYRTKKFLGEFFIIVWNLILVLAGDELTTFNSYEDPVEDLDGTDYIFNIMGGNQLFGDNERPPVLEKNEAKPYYLDLNKTKKFLYIMQAQQKPVTFTVIPCHHNLTITWSLYFRNKEKTGAVFDSSSFGQLLSTYKGMSMMNYASEPQFGLFELGITPFDQSTIIDVSIIDSDLIAPFLQLADNENSPRQIGIKFGFKNQSVTVKWNENFPFKNYEDTQYVVTINSNRFLKYLCETFDNETLQMLPDLQIEGKLIELSYPIRNLQYNKKYYVNVFIVHKTLLSVPYGKTSFIFRKTKPIGLKRNELVRGDLRNNDGKLSYKYKVSRRALPADMLVWYVIPCNGTVLVEIRHKKKIISKRTIHEVEAFQILNPHPGERYVMKLTDTHRSEHNPLDYVKVLVTTNAGYNSLMKLPQNLTVFVYKISNVCSSPERSTILRWWPVINNGTIVYCIRAIELDHESEKIPIRFPSQCELTDSIPESNTNVYEECYKKSTKSPEKPIIQKVGMLKPDRSYLIRVTAKKYNQKTIVSYNLLKINKNIHCLTYRRPSIFAFNFNEINCVWSKNCSSLNAL